MDRQVTPTEKLTAKGITVYSLCLCILSDGWSDRRDVVEGVEDYARGQMSLKIYSKHPAHVFDEYYLNLKPNNNLQNPWFEDFWEEKFKCSLRDSTKRLYSKTCSGQYFYLSSLSICRYL